MTSDTTLNGVTLQSMPILALRNAVLFPGAVMPVVIGRGKSIKLLEGLGDRRQTVVGVVAQKDKGIDNPKPEDLYWAGHRPAHQGAAQRRRDVSCGNSRT
jgi:ATP-dependent Lon protease